MFEGSSEKGAFMAAVREPSEPSMKPFSMPVCSIGSFVSWCSRILIRSRMGAANGSHSVMRRLSLPSFFICSKTRKSSEEIGPQKPAGALRSADEWHLRDDAFHTPVDCGDDQHMAAGVARPPHPDARRVGLIEAQRECDGVRIVPEL